ncbi:HYR domain protein [anaerobic digester metagenome]
MGTTEIAFPYSFPVGTTAVKAEATDINGLTHDCTFDVVVTDTQNPVVTCPTPAAFYPADAGLCAASLSFTATATDNCGVANIKYYVGATEITFPYSFPVGTTAMKAEATDINGLTHDCTFDVVVTDTQNPVVTCPTPAAFYPADAGLCAASLSFTATASDNCGVAHIKYYLGSTEITFPYSFPIGTTEVKAEATDVHGLMHNCIFDVVVTDAQNPVVTCPTPANPYTVNNGCTWTGAGLGVTIDDNCGSPTFSYSIDGGEFLTTSNLEVLNGYDFPIGTTDVVYRATDASGNIATCSFSIIVEGVTISGNLNYNNPSPQAPNTPYTSMNNVTVILRQGTTDVHTTTTGATGDYTFTGVCAGDYDVIFTTGKPVGGINSSDAAQVNAWGVGPQYTIEKVRFFAGDVNRNNYLQSSDAGTILNYFVTGGATPFNPRWTFWRAGETTITQNPLPNVLSISVPAGSAPITQNYYGMVTGDFNMSFVPGGAKSVMDNVMLNTGGTTLVDPGVEFELPVTAGMDMEIGAISLIIDFPADKLEVTGAYLGTDPTSPIEYALVGEELRIGWNALMPMSLTTGETLLTLKLRTTGSLAQGETIRLSLTADPLNELADGNYNTIPNALLFVDEIGGIATGVPDITFSNKLLLECYPNPFVDKTTFAYTLPKEGKVVLEMADMLGSKTDILLDALHAAGSHTFTVDMSSYSVGIYTATLRLHTGNDVISRTIKVIRRK